MTVITKDRCFPKILAKRVNKIPVAAIIFMSVLSFFLVLVGNLQVILEFGSVTFLLVSLLMAYANFRIRDLTHSSTFITLISIFGLMFGTVLILYIELINQPRKIIFIGGLYFLLTLGAWLYSKNNIYHIKQEQ